MKKKEFKRIRIKNQSDYKYNYRPGEWTFRLLGKGNNLIKGDTSCRDVIQLYLYEYINTKENSKTNPDDILLTSKSFRILLLGPPKYKQISEQRLHHILDFFHQQEKLLGFDLTKIKTPINPRFNDTAEYIFISDNKWLDSCLLISIYTLSLRVGWHHERGNDWHQTVDKLSRNRVEKFVLEQFIGEELLCPSRDIDYCMSAKKDWVNLVNNKYTIIDKKRKDNWTEELSGNCKYSGIVEYSKGNYVQTHNTMEAHVDG